jgi:hypothetical protein
MTNPMPSLKFFYNFLFRSYKCLIQRGKKKFQKTLRSVFTTFFDPFDSNAYKFLTKNCRRFLKMALVLSGKNLSETLKKTFILIHFVSLQHHKPSGNISMS